MSLGMKRDKALEIVGLTKNQFYHKSTGVKVGKKPSKTTIWRDPDTMIKNEVDNENVVQAMVEIKLDSDQSNWYRMITIRLQLLGYFINHKKVYRLMKDYLLLGPARKLKGRNFVKFRRVAPTKPLEVIEMDIKYVWIYEVKKYAYILTVIDTFTRYVLHYDVGYTMKSVQVQSVWEYIIAKYLQPGGIKNSKFEIEVRNDNGKQFCSNTIIDFFKNNYLNQVFTHPYTPEENGQVESFHSILANSIKNDVFTSLKELEERLVKFYTCYNNIRTYGSTKGLPPSIFWALYDLGKVEVIELVKRKIRYKLKVVYQDILSLPEINKYDYRVLRA